MYGIIFVPSVVRPHDEHIRDLIAPFLERQMHTRYHLDGRRVAGKIRDGTMLVCCGPTHLSRPCPMPSLLSLPLDHDYVIYVRLLTHTAVSNRGLEVIGRLRRNMKPIKWRVKNSRLVQAPLDFA